MQMAEIVGELGRRLGVARRECTQGHWGELRRAGPRLDAPNVEPEAVSFQLRTLGHANDQLDAS